tara:strand:- start:287 stop:442 length:156 start_codon:yes stop_codon:yes gene_type:complete
MKITQKQKTTIEKYLDYYYNEFSKSENGNKKPLSFENQMQLLYDHLTQIVK